jgi:aryl-alcohol dehydrogenase-like predicted oxidoreductase
MDFNEQRELGRSGLRVGRMGIASSYGAPAEALEEAFERGCNYFVWGSFIKGRKSTMRQAIINIARKGQRDKLVLALHSYSHSAGLMEHFCKAAIKSVGLEHVDVLLLGYYSRRPPERILERAQEMQRKGLIRSIGLTGHNRKVFPVLAREVKPIEVFHVRYNAAHRGAETEVFPQICQEPERPGLVSFTATRWGRLLNPRKMPPGEPPPSAPDCYRFVLSHPGVDVCMVGARTREQLREDLQVLDQGPLDEQQLARMRRIGDHVYGKKRQ